jgi:hypothetical protein
MRRATLSSSQGIQLNPLAAEIITALLNSSVEDNLPAEQIEELLTRFVCGFLTDDEKALVIGALTESGELRMQMLELRDQLKLQSQGLSEQTRVFHQDPTFANTLRNSLAAMLIAYGRWKSVCRMAFTTEPSRTEDPIIGQAFRTFGDSLRRQPLAIASTRGEETSNLILVDSGPTTAEISAHVLIDGSLQVSATLNPPLDIDRELSLYAVTNEGAWAFLGSSVAVSSKWSLAVEHFMERLGVPAGSLSGSLFALTEGPAFPSRQSIRLRRSDGRFDSWLSLVRQPAVSAGVFSVIVDIPEAVRSSLAGGVIAASISLGSAQFHIGEWSIDSLPSVNEVILQAPLPGITDCEIEVLSAINLTYRKIL